MLKYPDNFDTKTFPAGPRVALARVMAICVMVVFVLMIVAGGLIAWASGSRTVHPFLVSIDEFTGAWEVVGHDHGMRTITRNRAIQESIVAKFTQNWFTISAIPSENEDLWGSFADKSECNADNAPNRAQIYCNAGEELYNIFTNNIVSDYKILVDMGITWSVNTDDIYVYPTGDVTDDGGTWRVITQIKSGNGDIIPVIAYVTLANSHGEYPQNLGFYISDFNAYNTLTEL